MYYFLFPEKHFKNPPTALVYGSLEFIPLIFLNSQNNWPQWLLHFFFKESIPTKEMLSFAWRIV